MITEELHIIKTNKGVVVDRPLTEFNLVLISRIDSKSFTVLRGSDAVESLKDILLNEGFSVGHLVIGADYDNLPEELCDG